jgi:hypothetical protein
LRVDTIVFFRIEDRYRDSDVYPDALQKIQGIK